MKETKPTRDEWIGLYEAAGRVKALVPWEWMEETDVFGVENPETRELGFVSVMGSQGEHLSVAIYLGAEGLYGFWRLAADEDDGSAADILNVPQLQVSYEDRLYLTEDDRRVIKELGLVYRGRQAWPLFRSFRPGYWPWYVTSEEARWLTYALEQVEIMAPRVEEDPAVLRPGADETYLIRVFRDGVWADELRNVLPPEPVSIPLMMDMKALAAVRKLQRSVDSLEMDFFLAPARIGEKGKRPRYAYMLLVVDSRSGMVLEGNVLPAEPTVESMYGEVPLAVVRLFQQLGSVPKELRIRTSRLHQLLQPLAEELGFRLRLASTLPNLDPAKSFLLGQMRGDHDPSGYVH